MATERDDSRLRVKHIPFLIVLQAVLILLFAFFVEYDDTQAVYKRPADGHHHLVVGTTNGSDAVQSAEDHHKSSSDADVNTLGHYYPSKYIANHFSDN